MFANIPFPLLVPSQGSFFISREHLVQWLKAGLAPAPANAFKGVAPPAGNPTLMIAAQVT
jgi:hypothetical protein